MIYKIAIQTFFILRTLIRGLFFGLLLSYSSLASAYFYQINSETMNSPKTDTVQSDLKVLAGIESSHNPYPFLFRKSRFSLGSYSFYQSANDPTFYLRSGVVAQFRTSLFIDNLYLQYEHHEFQFRNSIQQSRGVYNSNWISENRWGLILFSYLELENSFLLDTYFETFLIPEVSPRDLLSVLRSTLIYKIPEIPIQPFAEVYLKQSPFLFGGDIRELRLGAKWQPVNSISLKLMSNCLPTSATSNAGILFQLNIFQEGFL